MSENSIPKEQIEEWLKPTLTKEGLNKYNITISGNTEKGENYLGVITFVEVSGHVENEEKVYSFVIKSGKKSKKLRKVMPIRSAFKNEIVFYNEIYPAFLQFQKEKEIDEPFNHAPKCYDTATTEDMEMLILENLKPKGYCLHERRQPMNREHIETVLKTYGKLHAVSYALKEQKPEVFKKLTEKMTDIFKLFAKIKAPEDLNAYQHIIKEAKKINDEKIIEAANILNEKVRNYNDITDPSDPYAIILHGDCWNNNFLFQYTDDKKTHVSNICLVDFQITRLASPVYDLSYFLFTTLCEETTQHFDEFNNIYYASLSKNLIKLGSDPVKMFPFEELTRQWKKFALLGLAMLPSIVNICLSDEDEVVDLEEVFGGGSTGNNKSEAFFKGIKNVDMFGKRTIPIMKLAIERDFV